MSRVDSKENDSSHEVKDDTLTQEILRRFQSYWFDVYRDFDLKNPENCWFWGTFVYTHLYVACLWLEVFTRPIASLLSHLTDIFYAIDLFTPNPLMYQMYLVLLGGYVLFNKTLRLLVRGQEVVRPGNYLFIMWIITGGFMFMLNSVTNGYLLVPRDLFNLMWQIASIFGLGEVTHKALERLIEKRVAEEQVIKKRPQRKAAPKKMGSHKKLPPTE